MYLRLGRVWIGHGVPTNLCYPREWTGSRYPEHLVPSGFSIHEILFQLHWIISMLTNDCPWNFRRFPHCGGTPYWFLQVRTPRLGVTCILIKILFDRDWLLVNCVHSPIEIINLCRRFTWIYGGLPGLWFVVIKIWWIRRWPRTLTMCLAFVLVSFLRVQTTSTQ